MSAKVQQLESRKSELIRKLATVRRQLEEAKAAISNVKRNNTLAEQRTVVARVLNGERITDVAKSLGVSASAVRMKVEKFCSKANPRLYAAGITGTTNRTPPLRYLRDNKHEFWRFM